MTAPDSEVKLDYDVEATRYPADEPEELTVLLMGFLAEIAHRRRQLMGRPEPNPERPAVGRYRELARTVECLIDCAGNPFPNYRDTLVALAAMALDAVIASEAKPVGQSG